MKPLSLAQADPAREESRVACVSKSDKSEAAPERADARFRHRRRTHLHSTNASIAANGQLRLAPLLPDIVL
jgi:hypothetical protein